VAREISDHGGGGATTVAVAVAVFVGENLIVAALGNGKERMKWLPLV
jgi:hypothetical protein